MMFTASEYNPYLLLVFKSSRVSRLWLMVDERLCRRSLYFVAFYVLHCIGRLPALVVSPWQALLLSLLSSPDQESNGNRSFDAHRHPQGPCHTSRRLVHLASDHTSDK